MLRDMWKIKLLLVIFSIVHIGSVEICQAREPNEVERAKAHAGEINGLSPEVAAWVLEHDSKTLSVRASNNLAYLLAVTPAAPRDWLELARDAAIRAVESEPTSDGEYIAYHHTLASLHHRLGDSEKAILTGLLILDRAITGKFQGDVGSEFFATRLVSFELAHIVKRKMPFLERGAVEPKGVRLELPEKTTNQVTFVAESSTNWGQEPMEVHALVFRSSRPVAIVRLKCIRAENGTRIPVSLVPPLTLTSLQEVELRVSYMATQDSACASNWQAYPLLDQALDLFQS